MIIIIIAIIGRCSIIVVFITILVCFGLLKLCTHNVKLMLCTEVGLSVVNITIS